MNIYEAQSLKDELLDIPAHADEIEVDLSQVTEIDSAGLQLLLLAQRETSKQGKALRITACSPAVQELIELYNLGALLGNAQPLPASGTVPP